VTFVLKLTEIASEQRSVLGLGNGMVIFRTFGEKIEHYSLTEAIMLDLPCPGN
jgi:hypothetical protein